jgi:tetratricopeptide (TPR) repeat protein
MKLKTVISVVLLSVLAFSSILLPQEMNVEAKKLLLIADSLTKAEDFKNAIMTYDQALAISKDYRIYFQKSLAQKKAQDLEGAKSSLEECLKLKNDFDAAYNAMGIVQFSIGNFQEARTNFEKFLTLSTKEETNKSVKKNLSITYYKLSVEEVTKGDTTKAIEYLNKSIEYDNYDATYFSLAKLYAANGEWDKSISAAENALKYKSKITEGGPYFYMGKSYKGKGDIQKAKEMFEKSKTDPAFQKTAEYELSQLK